MIDTYEIRMTHDLEVVWIENWGHPTVVSYSRHRKL